MIEQLNSIAQGWWSWMWPMFWQMSVLVILVGTIDLVLRRHLWPQLRYALWLLILVKLIMPPTLSLSTSIVSHLRGFADQTTAELETAGASADLPSSGSGLETSAGATGTEISPSTALETVPARRTPERAGSRPPDDAKLGWKAYSMTVWLIGVGILGWWLVVRLRRLRNVYCRQSQPVDFPAWFGPLLAETAQKLHLSKLPEIVLSREIPSPAVFGTFRPVLVLPEAAVGHLSRERAEHILLHELAHIKRGDLLVNTFYTLLQIVYWFNPLLWLLRRQLQHLRELCCDATVARILREKTPEYRETILETARRLLVKPVEPGIGLLGLFESSSRLRARLKWLERKTWKYRGLRFAAILVVVAFMCVFVMPMSRAKRTDARPGIDRNWPCFRGRGGSGISTHANIPDSWDGPSGEGIVWKSPVPLIGNSSPIVWGDRVFISGGKGDKLEVYCYDGSSGSLLWTGSVPMAKLPQGEDFEPFEDTGLASPTMVTDGRRVCAIFTTGDLGCFDFSGRRLWTKSLGIPDSAYGYASSLAIHGNLAIVQHDQGASDNGISQLIALDMASGQIVWQTKRPVANSWTSPIVTTIEGKDTIVTAADPWVIAYDAATGTELWRAECLAGDIAASPIYANGRVFAIEPYSKLVAIEAGGRGDVTKTHLAWNNEDGGPDICSPISDGQSIFLLADGLLTCHRTSDGTKLWEEDLREYFLASPSLVGGKLYLLSEKGTMFICRAGAEYKLLDKSALGEECRASPAFADGRIYIRGKKNLYCIGNTENRTSTSPSFAATLPNGITVEMMGVSTSPRQSDQWWCPDGRALETAPYDGPRAVLSGYQEHCREIAVRVAGDNAEDVSLTFEIPDYEIPEGTSKTLTWGQDSQHAILFRLLGDLPSIDVKIGVAYGKWTTTPYDFDKGQITRLRLMDDRESVIFDARQPEGLPRARIGHGAMRSQAMACANFAHRAMQLATRVVAIDGTGKAHEGARRPFGFNAKFPMYRYSFRLPADQVSKFSLQVRPYRWILFRNVSLQPGHRTNVLIDAEMAETIVAPSPSGAGPIGEDALSFDGVDDYLHVPAHPTLALKPPFTIEMWIKPDFSEMQAKIDADKLDPGKKKVLRTMWLARKFEATLDSKAPARGGFLMSAGPISRQEVRCSGNFYVGGKGSGMVQTGLFFGEPVESRRPGWLHVSESCTRENYVPVPDQPLVIGETFKGEIAEIRIWNRVSTFEDVLLYEHTSLTGYEPNLVACWDFNRRREHIVHDIGPNANHARLGKWAQIDTADPDWVDL